MKTRILLFLLLLSVASFGQSSGRSSLGVEIGASIPLGHYASTDAGYFDDSLRFFPGFAKTGMLIRMVYEHRLSHNFGFQADFIYGYNNVDQGVMADSLGARIDANISVVASNPWNIGGLLVGPFLRLPFTDEFSFMMRGKIGFVGVYSPQYNVQGTSNADQSSVEYYQYTNKATSFIWSAGAGFQYRLEHYNLNLYGDYFGADADFIDVPGQDWSSTPPVSTKISFRQQVRAISITFGISYVF